jgi:hypothetical protein
MNMTDTMDGWAGMVWHNAQRRLVSTRFSKWRKGGFATHSLLFGWLL